MQPRRPPAGVGIKDCPRPGCAIAERYTFAMKLVPAVTSGDAERLHVGAPQAAAECNFQLKCKNVARNAGVLVFVEELGNKTQAVKGGPKPESMSSLRECFSL